MALEKSVSAADNSLSVIGQTVPDVGNVFIIAQNVWLWFFAGALFGLLVFLIWNLSRSSK